MDKVFDLTKSIKQEVHNMGHTAPMLTSISERKI